MKDPFTKAPEKRLSDYNVAGASKTAIVIDCEQGDAQWWKNRIGVVSASRIGDFLKLDGTLKGGLTPKSYRNGLVAERLTRQIENQYSTPAMERGTELEPKARRVYEFETGRKVAQVGFILDKGRRWGGSPDGLCHDRGLEIKGPMHRGMIAAVMSDKPPTAYLKKNIEKNQTIESNGI